MGKTALAAVRQLLLRCEWTQKVEVVYNSQVSSSGGTTSGAGVENDRPDGGRGPYGGGSADVSFAGDDQSLGETGGVISQIRPLGGAVKKLAPVGGPPWQQLAGALVAALPRRALAPLLEGLLPGLHDSDAGAAMAAADSLHLLLTASAREIMAAPSSPAGDHTPRPPSSPLSLSSGVANDDLEMKLIIAKTISALELIGDVQVRLRVIGSLNELARHGFFNDVVGELLACGPRFAPAQIALLHKLGSDDQVLLRKLVLHLAAVLDRSGRSERSPLRGGTKPSREAGTGEDEDAESFVASATISLGHALTVDDSSVRQVSSSHFVGLFATLVLRIADLVWADAQSRMVVFHRLLPSGDAGGGGTTRGGTTTTKTAGTQTNVSSGVSSDARLLDAVWSLTNLLNASGNDSMALAIQKQEKTLRQQQRTLGLRDHAAPSRQAAAGQDHTGTTAALVLPLPRVVAEEEEEGDPVWPRGRRVDGALRDRTRETVVGSAAYFFDRDELVSELVALFCRHHYGRSLELAKAILPLLDTGTSEGAAAPSPGRRAGAALALGQLVAALCDESMKKVRTEDGHFFTGDTGERAGVVPESFDQNLKRVSGGDIATKGEAIVRTETTSGPPIQDFVESVFVPLCLPAFLAHLGTSVDHGAPTHTEDPIVQMAAARGLSQVFLLWLLAVKNAQRADIDGSRARISSSTTDGLIIPSISEQTTARPPVEPMSNRTSFTRAAESSSSPRSDDHSPYRALLLSELASASSSAPAALRRALCGDASLAAEAALALLRAIAATVESYTKLDYLHARLSAVGGFSGGFSSVTVSPTGAIVVGAALGAEVGEAFPPATVEKYDSDEVDSAHYMAEYARLGRWRQELLQTFTELAGPRGGSHAAGGGGTRGPHSARAGSGFVRQTVSVAGHFPRLRRHDSWRRCRGAGEVPWRRYGCGGRWFIGAGAHRCSARGTGEAHQRVVLHSDGGSGRQGRGIISKKC